MKLGDMKLGEKTGNVILGIAGVVGGLVIIGLSFAQDMAFIARSMPGPGFFPIICGGMISLMSAWLLLEVHMQSRKQKAEGEQTKQSTKNLINVTEIKSFLWIIGLSWFVVLLAPTLGMLICIMAVVFALVKFLGREGWIKSLLVALGTTVAMYLIFGVFLNVPMPIGILGF